MGSRGLISERHRIQQIDPRGTVIDLFCGAGGISHGFENAGFQALGGVDSDPDSIATFKRNHPHARGICTDLSSTTGPELGAALGVKPDSIDCMAAGPPCQGFSRNRAFRHKDGKFVDDPRNHLYWHFFGFVKYFRPRVVVMENVPEILIKSNGFFRDAVYQKFESLGYHVNAQILNAAEYGVPQRRRRAIFLAGRDGTEIPIPQRTHRLGVKAMRRTPGSRQSPVAVDEYEDNLQLFRVAPVSPSVWDAISDLHGEYSESLNGLCGYASEPSTVYQRERRGRQVNVSNHFPWPLTERQLRRIRLLGEGQSQAFLPQELQTKGGYGSAYRRMQSDAQALTLTTWMFHPGSGMFTHPKEDRVITIREAARIQLFQDQFVFTGGYHSQCRQIGNSVAPLVAKNLAVSIASALDGEELGNEAQKVLVSADSQDFIDRQVPNIK